MIRLYYSPGACSLAVHIALERTGAAYEAEVVSVHAGETRREPYLSVNPRGRVPALLVDGTVLTETVAILAFLARAFPAAGLLPPEPLGEARALSLLAWFASTVHPAFAHVVRPERFAEGEAAQAAIRERATATYLGHLREMDAMLRDRPWFAGESMTACDMHALPLWGFGRRVRLPMDDMPRLLVWKDRMLAEPAVLRVLQREGSPLVRGLP